MPSYEEIKQQIAKLGSAADTFGTKKEIRALPEILRDGEEVKGLTSGILNNNTWLIVCTNRRVLFVDKGMLWGIQQLDMPLEKINSFEYKTGILFGEFTIWDGSSKAAVGMIQKQTLKPFVDALNAELERVRSRGNSHSNGPLDVADQLKKLADLKQQGVLTEEEFQVQKKKILSA